MTIARSYQPPPARRRWASAGAAASKRRAPGQHRSSSDQHDAPSSPADGACRSRRSRQVARLGLSFLPQACGDGHRPRPHHHARAHSPRTPTPRFGPKSLDEFVGQQGARENLRVFVNAAKSARRGARPCPVLRPARARQDHARRNPRPRDGGRLPRHLGPGHRQVGRPRRAADQPRGRRRPVHRRDPPPRSRGRGNPLPGDGGPRARPDDRRGPVGALGPHRPAQIHLDRRHHPPGPADHAAARPLRHPDPPQFLHASRELEQVVRRAARLLNAPTSPTTARTRSPAARAARRASPAACSAGCAISPMPRAPTRSTPTSPTARSTGWRSTRLGLDAMDRRYLTMIADLYGGGPVGIETLAAGLSEPRDTIEDVIEPYPHSARPHRPHRTRPLPQRPRLDPSRPQSARRGADRPVRHRRRSEMMRIDLSSALAALDRRSRCRPARRCLRPPVDYSKAANWLCLPGRADVCSAPLATTALNPNGYGSTGRVDRRQGPAGRLLLRLSDRVARPRPQQRPQHVGGESAPPPPSPRASPRCARSLRPNIAR